MKQLTKEQVDKLWDFCGDESVNTILCNGQRGYCKETKTVIVCCSVCGEYISVKLDDIMEGL